MLLASQGDSHSWRSSGSFKKHCSRDQSTVQLKFDMLRVYKRAFLLCVIRFDNYSRKCCHKYGKNIRLQSLLIRISSVEVFYAQISLYFYQSIFLYHLNQLLSTEGPQVVSKGSTGWVDSTVILCAVFLQFLTISSYTYFALTLEKNMTTKL